MKNLHGDVVGLAGANATTPAATRSYDPWGNPLTSAGSSSSVRGYQGDPGVGDTDLVQTDTRVIDPSLGRFMSQDILFGSATDPMSLNQYVYGEDTPIDKWDPTGMSGCARRHDDPCPHHHQSDSKMKECWNGEFYPSGRSVHIPESRG